MANPQVDRLIQELSMILEQNRQKRNAADSMMLGIQQGKAQAAAAQPKPQYDSTGYDNHRNKMLKGDENDGLGTLSPNYRAKTNAAPRDGGFGQAYEDAQFQDAFNKTPGNAPPASLDVNDAIEEERRKRVAQQFALAHGQQGPLGGAGMPAPGGDQKLASQVQAAGNPDLGKFGTMSQGAVPIGNPMSDPRVDPNRPMAMNAIDMSPSIARGDLAARPGAATPGAPPAGWSSKDYDLLSALAQRYQAPQ